MADGTTAVAQLLEAAGFSAPPDDVAELVADYATVRQMVALLYTVDEARYEAPAIVFQPDPRFTDWA